MIQRAITTLIATPVVLAILWLGGVYWVLLVLVFALLGGYELYALLDKAGLAPSRPILLLWITLLVLGSWPPLALPITAVVGGGMILTLIYALFQGQQPLVCWMSTSSGALYIGIMLAQAAMLRLIPDGLWWMLLALLIPWINDTTAYTVGISVGRHKLWPRMSPKKSWEGTVGGWLGAMVAAGFFCQGTPLNLGFGTGAGLGLLGGVLALFGDLSISMLKRQAGVKDSGRLFPGHGGMLDRMDSVLFVAPFIYQMALWLG